MNGRTREISKLGCAVAGALLAGWLAATAAVAAPAVAVPSLLPVQPRTSTPATGSPTSYPAAVLPAVPAGPTTRPWHTGGPRNGHLPGFRPAIGSVGTLGAVGATQDSADESPDLLRTTTVSNQDPVAVITVVLIALAVLGLPLRRGLERAGGGLAGLLPRRRRRRLYGERWVNQHLTVAVVPAVPTGSPLACEDRAPDSPARFPIQLGMRTDARPAGRSPVSGAHAGPAPVTVWDLLLAEQATPEPAQRRSIALMMKVELTFRAAELIAVVRHGRLTGLRAGSMGIDGTLWLQSEQVARRSVDVPVSLVLRGTEGVPLPRAPIDLRQHGIELPPGQHREVD